MTMTIDTPAAIAATQAAATLDRLKARQADYEEAALAGTLSPAAVTEIEGELRFAQMRADAANRAAEAERKKLGDSSTIAALLKDFLADPELSTTPLARAYERVTEALADFEKLNTVRNTRVGQWGSKLREAGVPDNGLTVDGRPVRLSTNGSLTKAIGRIDVGAASAQAVADPTPYMRGAVATWVKSEGINLPAAGLNGLDTREAADEQPLEVTVKKTVGGHSVGTRLSSYTTSRAALARLVHGGYADVASGDLPEPTLTERIAAGNAEREQARLEEAAAYRVH